MNSSKSMKEWHDFLRNGTFCVLCGCNYKYGSCGVYYYTRTHITYYHLSSMQYTKLVQYELFNTVMPAVQSTNHSLLAAKKKGAQQSKFQE